jgi:hypothetical protein
VQITLILRIEVSQLIRQISFHFAARPPDFFRIFLLLKWPSVVALLSV